MGLFGDLSLAKFTLEWEECMEKQQEWSGKWKLIYKMNLEEPASSSPAKDWQDL